MKKNIYNVLRGTFLISDDSFKNWRLIMFLSSLAIIMIASSHRADRKVYENESDANADKATTVTKNGVTYAPKHFANSTVVSE